MELTNRLDVLDLMFQAGCREIYFGLETGSKRMMHECKGIDLDAAMNVLNHAASLSSGKGDRLQTVAGFIIGHPEDTEETVEETIQLALELRRLRIDTMLSIMQPYPGSLLHKTPERYGIKIENADYSEYLYPKANLSTQYLTRERIRTLYASGLLRIMETYERDG
jgi:anaerobic magnesium-protoporphyrin IX monomethyl ester cyclase